MQGSIETSKGARLFAFAQGQGHNPWLDVLRSLAIILVLLRHGSRQDNAGLAEGFWANLFHNGWVGVDLFFVLSGYLIARGLLRRAASGGGSLFPRGYFKDRILRIVPAYYAVLGLCVLGAFPGMPAAEPASVLAHLAFLHDYTGADINVVFWSLGVEEKFYIIAPVIVLLLARQTSAAALAGLAAALFLAAPLARGLSFEAMGAAADYDTFFAGLRSPFHMSLEGFVVGILVAIVAARGHAIAPRSAAAGLAASLLLLVIAMGSHEFLGAITRIDAWAVPSLLALLFGVMVLCAGNLGAFAVPGEPFFRVNARLSYALYLVHFPLLPLALALSDGQHPVWFWSAYLALSYLAALALHFAVEKPFLLLKAALNRTPAAAPAPPAGAALS